MRVEWWPGEVKIQAACFPSRADSFGLPVVSDDANSVHSGEKVVDEQFSSDLSAHSSNSTPVVSSFLHASAALARLAFLILRSLDLVLDLCFVFVRSVVIQ